MKTGLRPMRSARVAQAGMAMSATTLVTMATHSMVVLSRPTVSTANDSAHTAKIVLTVEASAPNVTRSTLARWSRSSTATGMRSTPSSAVWPKAGASSSLRRMSRPATTTRALSQNGMRHPQLSS